VRRKFTEGLRRNGLHDVPVIPIETEGADSHARYVNADRGHRHSKIATTLGAKNSL
jgi:L-serine/L-threonine ammonia-lyase